jgi:hypothetical protein
VSGETRWQPGPWQHNDAKFGDLCDANGDRVVFTGLSLAAGYSGDRAGQIEANSTVAKAAPDLYEALEEMVEKGEGCVTGREDCGPECCRYGRSRAALARALGEEAPHA